MILDRLPASRLAEWEAYYQLEPWGDDWNQVVYLVAAVTGRKPQQVAEFIKPGEKTRKLTDPHEIERRMTAAFRSRLRYDG